MGKFARRLTKLTAGVGIAGAACLMWAGPALAVPNAPAPACVDRTAVTGISFTNQNNVTLPPAVGNPGMISGVLAGDTITVHFSVVSTTACPNGVQLTLASYGTQTANFVVGAAQNPYQAATSTFGVGGPYTLVVQIPQTIVNDPNCNPQHDNSNGGGANQSPGPYDPNGCGLPSGNGKSTNNNSSKPCAGCVGNADAKNPPGQYPNGSDPNAGYECDRNQGVGQTNPAHTGCVGSPHFQMDFVSGLPITDFTTGATYNGQGRLIDFANG